MDEPTSARAATQDAPLSVAVSEPSPQTLPTLAALVIDTAVRLGVSHWVLSPGSRSAPLTVALAQRNDVCLYVVYDERSAGHIALGIAQQLRRAVGLVCTSGTAALNLAPAITEAYYQSVPLLVLTADRPPEWIDQQDNQAIHQNGLYRDHVRASFTLPVDDGTAATRGHAVRTVCDALACAHALAPGPVHINAPLREPLYTAHALPLVRPAHLPQTPVTQPTLAAAIWDLLQSEWSQARRILIVGGPHPEDERLRAALRTLGTNPAVVTVGDITANLRAQDGALQQWDAALATRDDATLNALAPDLVISFGGAVTSRNLKALLRSRPPRAFWRVGPSLPAPDTYQALTRVLPLHPADFFAALAAGARPHQAVAATYAADWAACEARASATLARVLDDSPFGEFAAVRALLAALPAGALLQIGNSMPIRYANLLGVQPGHLPTGVYANRGVSGIDGCVSTAVGAALARPDLLTLLIVGDLAFFYDRNGLWHAHLPPNLRLALLNNHGGGIFDVIDGPDTLPDAVRRTYFLTPQPLRARRTAEDHGLDYTAAADADAVQRALPAFFAASERAQLLEIATDIATNTAIFRALRARLGALAQP